MTKTNSNSAQINENESNELIKKGFINSNSADGLAEAVTNDESDSLKTSEFQANDVKMYCKDNYDEGEILKKEVQTPEQNAEFARRRRENEMREKIEQAKLDAVIEALDGINPLTNERMSTREDARRYLEQKYRRKTDSSDLSLKTALDQNNEQSSQNFNVEAGDKTANNQQIDKNTGQIMAENLIYAKNAAGASEQSEKEWQEKLSVAERQKREYLINHTEEEYVSLMKNDEFLNFVSDKSEMSLEDKQAKYNAFIEKIEHNAKLVASQILANKLSSPGALRTDTPVETSYLSREQVENMTSQEIHENYDKIKKSMKHWK